MSPRRYLVLHVEQGLMGAEGSNNGHIAMPGGAVQGCLSQLNAVTKGLMGARGGWHKVTISLTTHLCTHAGWC